MAHKILVADDEVNITDVCTRYLAREGYQVISAQDGEQALHLWRREKPDLIVLDLMMPRINGWQVCEEIRNGHEVPIIMLTARGEEMERLMGLTMGADDYITKPFSPRELVLRVKGILRRTYGREAVLKTSLQEETDPTLHYPGIEINERQRTVRVEGRSVSGLTVKEFELLWMLASHPEQVFSRSQLLNSLWEIDYFGDTTTVTVHIRRLREKLEPNPSQPKYIKTVWGIGYKFERGDRS